MTSYELKDENIPEWIIKLLDRYGNCACGRDIVTKYGDRKLLSLLRGKGYNCILKIKPDQNVKYKRKRKYPLSATYILWVSN